MGADGTERQMTTSPSPGSCPWCGRRFTLRRDSGKEQRFCSAMCRHALDATGRRWIAAALVSGALTLDHLRSDSLTTRALLRGAISPRPVPEARADASTPVPPAEGLAKATELLDDFLVVLLDPA
jgi:hypothetical protein